MHELQFWPLFSSPVDKRSAVAARCDFGLVHVRLCWPPHRALCLRWTVPPLTAFFNRVDKRSRRGRPVSISANRALLANSKSTCSHHVHIYALHAPSLRHLQIIVACPLVLLENALQCATRRAWSYFSTRPAMLAWRSDAQA